MLSVLLTSIGLALPAGLNAWIPMLVLALSDRFSDQVELAQPFDFISSTPGIVLILLLLPVELVADKIPGVDHISDLVHSFIRPIVGAVLAAAVADASQDLNVYVAALLGLGGAGATHAVKMSTRPAITVSTGGLGNPIASSIEDALAGVSSLMAIFLPFMLLLLLPLLGISLFLTWRRLRQGSARLRSLARR